MRASSIASSKSLIPGTASRQPATYPLRRACTEKLAVARDISAAAKAHEESSNKRSRAGFVSAIKSTICGLRGMRPINMDLLQQHEVLFLDFLGFASAVELWDDERMQSLIAVLAGIADAQSTFDIKGATKRRQL
jgi:hypothetical protein